MVAMYVCDCVFFCFKQKTAYEMRISDWSSDVCSSDLCRTQSLFGDPDRGGRQPGRRDAHERHREDGRCGRVHDARRRDAACRLAKKCAWGHRALLRALSHGYKIQLSARDAAKIGRAHV